LFRGSKKTTRTSVGLATRPRIEYFGSRIRNSSAEVDTRSDGDSLFVYTFLSVTGYQRIYKIGIQITVPLVQYLDYGQQTEESLFDFRKMSEVLVLYIS
jgi:hypothetical protein